MTQREFLSAVSKVESLQEELVSYALAEIEKLDKANEAKKAKPSKAQLENAPLIEKIETLLSDNCSQEFTASDLVVAIPELGSVQKASSLVRKVAESGKATTSEIKGKKGKVKAYRWAMVQTETLEVEVPSIEREEEESLSIQVEVEQEM